jgi:hypothetical protein
VLGDSGEAEDEIDHSASSEIAYADQSLAGAGEGASCESNQSDKGYSAGFAKELKDQLATLNKSQRRQLAQAYAEEYFGKVARAEQFTKHTEGDDSVLHAILSEFHYEAARFKFCTELG